MGAEIVLPRSVIVVMQELCVQRPCPREFGSQEKEGEREHGRYNLLDFVGIVSVD